MPLRRLNRTEYNNTVRDLLGTQLTPADEFPADDSGEGFDNLAQVLSISPTHIEAHLRAGYLDQSDTFRRRRSRPEKFPRSHRDLHLWPVESSAQGETNAV